MVVVTTTIASVASYAVAAELDVNGTAAIYINNDGYTANGASKVTYRGKSSQSNPTGYTYSSHTSGSYNGAVWGSIQFKDKTASFWQDTNNFTVDKITNRNTKSVTKTYTSANAVSDRLDSIRLDEGESLYLGGTAYKGTVIVDASSVSLTDYATIAAYSPSTTSVSINKLTGLADVLFLGVATGGTTNFTVTDATGYAGTVYMSADTGAVQLNIKGDSWANTVFDFKKDAALSKSAIESNVKAPSQQTLALTADTSVEALSGGSSTAYVTGAYQLTVGQNATQDYTYAGNLGNTLHLVKEGGYAQRFSSAATIAKAEVHAGVLDFDASLTATEVAVSGGATLHTGAGSHLSRVNLEQGAIWVVDNNTTIDDLTFTGGSATLRGVGENVVLMAPTAINLFDYNGDVLNAPFFTLDNLTLDIDHTLMLNGYTGNFEKGDVINFAQLTNGAGYAGAETIAVSHGTHVHTVNVTVTQDNMLQFTVGGLKPDLLVNGIAVLYLNADGKASGNTTVTAETDWRGNVRSYSLTNHGSYDGQSIAWNTSVSSSNSIGYWLSYDTGSTTWRGTDDGGITDSINTIQLIEGNALYLGGAAYGGSLLVAHSSASDDVATIAAYDPSTTSVTINKLEGQADVLFLGVATDSDTTTTFTVNDASEYAGTVYMTANGSKVQVNIAGDWADALFHFGREEGMSNSAIDATGSLPSAQILNLTGNAVVKGLADGSPYALVTGKHTLTLGHDGEDYEYFGKLGEEISGSQYGELSLTKVGSNTQYIDQHADLKDITVEAGTLHFAEVLHAVNATVNGGSMQITNGSFTGEVSLTGGVLQTSGALHADSLSHSGGELDVATDIVVAHRMELSGSVQDTIVGTLDTSELFLNDSAQLSILNNAIVHDNLELNGGSLTITGALQVENLIYRSGALSTGAGTHVQQAVLSGGTDWHLGDNTTIVNMTLEGITATQSATLTGGSATLSGSILNENANTAYAWLTLNNTNLQLQNGSVLRGADIGESTTTMLFANLDSLSSLSTLGGALDVYSAAGGKYEGVVRTEGNVVYVDLTPTWDDLIWSGVQDGTTVRDAAHHNGQLVMGHVWRADGSSQNTGWHEQNVGAGDGVYVDNRDVIFSDTDYHGKNVSAAGRDVLIVGKVAPGNIYVTADTESGLVTGGSEARMKYGYAFYAQDITSGIADYVDAEGNITPTRIIKDGEALLVLNSANTFSGGIDVNAGGLYLATPGAAGTGAIRVHTDNEWSLDVWNSAATTDYFQTFERVGTELMVCYLHSNENASAFRSGTVANDIIMTDQDPTKAGQFAISFARAGFNLSGSDNDHANTPRHWRCLTLSGALVGTGNKEDKLVLTGYSSTWGNYRDQSYVTAFALNERTKSDQSLISNFNGTVVLKNTINTSPLWTNRLAERTAGTVQVMLSDNKLQYALMDLTRESVVVDKSWEESGDRGIPRQSYNNILVLNGEVGLRGLSADFHGAGHVYTWDGKATEWGSSGSRKYQTLAQNEEVWHVRTVANAMTTLTLGTHEDTDTAVYVYSGAMGVAQSYVEPTQAAVMWGDGFDAPPTGAND